MYAICQSETLMDLAPQYGRLFNTLGFPLGPSPPPRVLHPKGDRLVLCSVRAPAMASCGRTLHTLFPCNACQGHEQFKCILGSAHRSVVGHSALGSDFDWPWGHTLRGSMDLWAPSERSSEPSHGQSRQLRAT